MPGQLVCEGRGDRADTREEHGGRKEPDPGEATTLQRPLTWSLRGWLPAAQRDRERAGLSPEAQYHCIITRRDRPAAEQLAQGAGPARGPE